MQLTPEVVALLKQLTQYVASHSEKDMTPSGWLSNMQGNPVFVMTEPHGLLALIEQAGVSAETINQWCVEAAP